MNNENEEWKYLDYDQRYMISNDGKIFSLHWAGTDAIREIIPSITKDGYYKVSLTHNKKLKTFLVHRLVADTFIPNPYRHKVVNHVDGNKLNNNVNNLEWCSQKDNVHHAVKSGLYNTKKVGKYDQKGNLLEKYNSIAEASRKNGISSTTIGDVCRLKGKTAGGYKWKYID